MNLSNLELAQSDESWTINDDDENFTKAENYLRARKFQSAIKYYSLALKSLSKGDADFRSALVGRGDARRALHQNSGALDDYKRAAKIDANDNDLQKKLAAVQNELLQTKTLEQSSQKQSATQSAAEPPSLPASSSSQGSASASAATCDDKLLGQQLNAKWLGQLQSAKGSSCQTARVMQAYLGDAKNAYSQCLVGETLNETLAKLDQSIQQWGETEHQVCD